MYVSHDSDWPSIREAGTNAGSRRVPRRHAYTQMHRGRRRTDVCPIVIGPVQTSLLPAATAWPSVWPNWDGYLRRGAHASAGGRARYAPHTNRGWWGGEWVPMMARVGERANADLIGTVILSDELWGGGGVNPVNSTDKEAAQQKTGEKIDLFG